MTEQAGVIRVLAVGHADVQVGIPCTEPTLEPRNSAASCGRASPKQGFLGAGGWGSVSESDMSRTRGPPAPPNAPAAHMVFTGKIDKSVSWARSPGLRQNGYGRDPCLFDIKPPGGGAQLRVLIIGCPGGRHESVSNQWIHNNYADLIKSSTRSTYSRMSWSSSAYLDECYHDTEASGDRKDYYQGIHFRMPRWSTGDPINSADVNSSMRPSVNGFAQGPHDRRLH
jgi:hypothetical protein